MPLPGSYSDDTGINVVTSDPDTAYAAGLLINQNLVAEGSNIPPKQFGENRVPIPTGFKVLGSPTYSALGFIYTLSWQDIPAGYSTRTLQYDIYAQTAFDLNPTPTLVGSSPNSPCTVRVVSSQAGLITFWLRPVLANGLTLPLASCPTCTSTAPNPYYQFDILSPTSGTEATILINAGVVYSKLPQAGLEVYYTSNGINATHTTLVPGKLELDSGSTSQGYINVLVLGSHAAQLNIYDDPIPGGALPLVQLTENPVPTTGTYFGQITAGGSGLGTATNKAGFVQLDAKTNTVVINDGAGNQTTYTNVLQGVPGGALTAGLKVHINGSDYTIGLY